MKTGSGSFRILIAIGFLSAASLLFETGLTRFLAVAQFYHFAFLVISLALLGFAASGTIISIFPQIIDRPLDRTLSRLAIGFSLTIWLSYSILNWLPFDSYSIAWDRIQILYFVLYYFSLTLPFIISGLALGIALAASDRDHHLVYGVNLLGSGLGVLAAPVILGLSGVLGLFILCSLLSLIGYMILTSQERRQKYILLSAGFLVVIASGIWINLVISNLMGESEIGFKISPYKGLSYARQYPGAKQVFGMWEPSSRIDVMADAGIRRLPGLSYAYPGDIPPQLGLSIDGEALQPITLIEAENFLVGEWLPEWWGIQLTSNQDAMVINPGGGYGVLQVMAESPDHLTVVMAKRSLPEIVRKTAPAHSVYDQPNLKLMIGNPRGVLLNDPSSYDLVYMPLTDAYQPITNGFYSITENYSLTIDSVESAISCLSEGGVLVVSRWLQQPPSEGLRLIITISEALKRSGVENPENSLVIYRGIQTITVIARPTGWQSENLRSLRDFLDRSRLDLVWAPDLETSELNRWNQLEEPIYYQQIKAYLDADDHRSYFREYPYDVSPPTDDRPFFFHFFTWKQAPGIMASFGRTWQPFGGSGYFLLIFLLVLVIGLSAVLILAPLRLLKSKPGTKQVGRGWVFLYFGLIGIGFMFLEIPLISQWGLFLRAPIYAFSLIVGVLLLSSSLGSMFADHPRMQGGWMVPALFLFGGGFILISTLSKNIFLGFPAWIRVLLPCLGLFPIGISLGTFFPHGLGWVKKSDPYLVPWVWAVNGSASVTASVLAAMISLQGGFPLVIALGGICYLGAWVIKRRIWTNAPR